MVLYNSARRARDSGMLLNANQGGGEKKAGFPYMIGRDSWASIFIRATDPINKHCCKLDNTASTTVIKSNFPIWVRPGIVRRR